MAHENIGAEIIEIFIVFTHSAHPEISKLSVNIIKQLSLIKGNPLTPKSRTFLSGI